MKHLCYVYIYEYKCLKDIEFVLDSRYNFIFSKEEAKLSITKNEEFPTDFWGKSINSVAAIIGNNGTGKSTAMSFLLAFLVEGSACESLNGIIVFEQDGRFYYYGKEVSVVFGNQTVKSVNSSLNDSIWKIPCFYHSGHFTPDINNDPRNSYFAGSYFASDIVRLVEDSKENASPMNLPLSRYLDRHVAQNNYRICMMLANRELSDAISKNFEDFKWPRYVIVGINKSGATAIENAIRNEKVIDVNEEEDQFLLEDFDRMLEFDSEIMRISRLVASNLPQPILKLEMMARQYYDNGEKDKALDCYTKVLDNIPSTLDTDNLDRATIFQNIAVLYYYKEEYDNALDFSENALQILLTVLGEGPRVFMTYYSMAKTLYAKREYDRAIDYYHKSMKGIVGNDSGFVAIYTNIAKAYYAKKDNNNALEYCNKALVISRNGSPYNPCDIAIAYSNTAKAYYSMSKYIDALDCYSIALDYVSDAIDRATIFMNMARVHETMGNYDDSLKYYSNALVIREREYGENHLKTQKLNKSIARVYSLMGDEENALEYQNKVKTVPDIPTGNKNNNNAISIPPFKQIFDASSSDHLFSQLIYYNLLNVIHDKWGWRKGFDIVDEWQNQLQSKTPILEQLRVFITRVSDTDKKNDLKSLYDMLVKIEVLAKFKKQKSGNHCLYIDCRDDKEKLIKLGDEVLNSNKYYLISHFFDLSYSHSLDSYTILSSGEQELMNLFSRFYDSIVLHPKKYPNSRIPSLLMLDEAEIGFHPDWQRRYLKLVIDFLAALKETDPKIPAFQIIISTHSPILLSDIPKSCTNYLKTENKKTIMANRNEIGETFAENVFQLYRKSFFMEKGLVGEFARKRINKLKDRIEEGKIDGVMNEIKMIGDDGIREFLMDEFHKKHPKDESVKKGILRYYEEKVEQIKNSKG